MTTGHAEHSATLRDYLHVLRRRKWIVLQAVVLVPAAALAFSLHQQKLYQASAQVLLSTQNLAAELTGTQQQGVQIQPDRVAQTQADVARVPTVAASALRSIRYDGLSPLGLLNTSSVSTATNADILTFEVTNHNPVLAELLVNAYARAYTIYRRQLDTSAIHAALKGVDAQITRLGRTGRATALYRSLLDRQQTLATMQALQTSNASVVKTADGVAQTQPKTSRNTILGILLGIILGVGLAFLWEALDTRVRSAQEIGERLGGLPMLGRLPVPGKQFRGTNRLVMLGDPRATEAESFRMLRTSLEFATLGRDARTIMITSAVQQEGKSTTIANLAVALARAGQRVVLVDLDLRRPLLDKFFQLKGPGITQVALGHVTLEQALTPVVIADGETRPRTPPANGNGHVRVNRGDGAQRGNVVKGILEVLPSGPIPPDPGEFVRTAALSEILAQLRVRTDFVLIDAPPVLQVGDAMALSTQADGILARGEDEDPPPAHAQRARPAARDLADAGARLRRHGRRGRGRVRLRVRLWVRIRRVRPAPVRAEPERAGRAGEDGAVNHTRILVADSLRIFRAGVRNLLARESEFAVVEAGSLDELLAVADEECPDIALVDLDLPPLGGVEAVQRLARRCSAYTIVWSFDPSRETVLAAVRAGAHGYLRKEISPEGLIRALRGVAQGEAPLSRDLASLMIDALHGMDERAYARERAAVLSAREREVLELVAQGARNKQIAAALVISEFTVKRHVQNILQKLDLPSRRAAATFYRTAFGPEESLAVPQIA